MRQIGLIVISLALLVIQIQTPAAANDQQNAVLEWAHKLISQNAETRAEALAYFDQRGETDAVPALILSLRFIGAAGDATGALLDKLTGADIGGDWHNWMLWQEQNPEVKPFPGFDSFQAYAYRRVDPNFQLFLGSGIAHEIRLEEITWGGVTKDGIPALTNPRLISAEAAAYMKDDDLVFGVAINGDSRAYPLRILNWHEMFNDTIGGVPVSLAYCTLCGSGILFETSLDGYPHPLIFGSSGFLYRSNKLMYDTYTHSLWNQFTGRPVVGRLAGSGVELKTRPVVITNWADWRTRNPSTKVLDVDTGFPRDYGSGVAYRSYFSSPDLMFPTIVDETRLKQKDYVFALRSEGTEKAWPLALFEGGAVVNDRAGAVDLVLIGDTATRSVRAYRTEGQKFEPAETTAEVRLGDETWKVTETALIAADGREMPRLAGHIAYWFAWDGYFGKAGGELGGK